MQTTASVRLGYEYLWLKIDFCDAFYVFFNFYFFTKHLIMILSFHIKYMYASLQHRSLDYQKQQSIKHEIYNINLTLIIWKVIRRDRYNGFHFQ
jgi:hypothetical protein